MTTVRDQLDTCQFLLNRARLAEDDNAIRVKSKCVVCEDGHCVISSFRLSVQQR